MAGTRTPAAGTAAAACPPGPPAGVRVHRKPVRRPWTLDATSAPGSVRAALAHEALVASAASTLAGPAGAPLAPRGVAVQGDAIVTEWLDRHTSLHELHERGEPGEPARAMRWGDALALLHGAAPPTWLPPAPSAIPRPWALRPRDLASLPVAGLEIVARLQAAEGMTEALDDLASTAPPSAFVHGDAKLDNVMWGPGGELRLVDWELGGVGDPRWDLGSAIGDYLARWLASARIERTRPLRSWLATATTSRSSAATAARAVVAGYERTSGRGIDEPGVARYVGVFFLHRAQAWAERIGCFGARATLLATVGERLIVLPRPTLDALLRLHGR
jgi:aminoglycoside phosphotransferase (APT) family kinase protein